MAWESHRVSVRQEPEPRPGKKGVMAHVPQRVRLLCARPAQLRSSCRCNNCSMGSDAHVPVPGEIARDCIAVRLRLLGRVISRIYDEALRPHGMTIAQLNVLATVDSLGSGVPAGRVAEVLSMEISTFSRNARLMESAGWIDIARAERGNGRVVTVTRAGAHKLSEVTPAWREAQAEAARMLGADGVRLVTATADSLWHKENHTGPK